MNMNEWEIEFLPEEMDRMAEFIAALIKKGIGFKTYRPAGTYNFMVVLTGGF